MTEAVETPKTKPKWVFSPCACCGTPQPSYRNRKGIRGKTFATRTTYYRETLRCTHCNVSVESRSPGLAVKMWNMAYEAKRWLHAKEPSVQ